MAKYSYSVSGHEERDFSGNWFPLEHYEGDVTECAVPLHWHEELEAGYVTAGSVTLKVGQEETVLEKGDGFLINANAFHALFPAEDPSGCTRSLVFQPVIVGGREDSVYWGKYCRPLLTANISVPYLVFRRTSFWQKDAVSAIRLAWESRNAAAQEYELEVRYALSHLLHLVVSHAALNENPLPEKTIRDNERIRQMLQFIQTHYPENLTTEQIAGSASISVSECLRCFRATIAVPPISYLKDYRIQQASALLERSALTVSQIGEACGFQDMSYFSRVFRELRQCTPVEYRRAHARPGRD